MQLGLPQMLDWFAPVFDDLREFVAPEIEKDF
jgi:hypothetical protein